MVEKALRIITRKSPLAMWQAEHVRARLLQLHDGLAVEISGVTTEADRFLDRGLASMGGKGVFVKELEQALLDSRADLAVHSMKDVPVDLPEGLCIAAVLEREDVRDAFVSNGYPVLDELPQGARVGTSSLRRRSQLLALRPDLEIVDIRGNVGTRLTKLDNGAMDALILAAAGVKRLGEGQRITQLLEPDVMLPAIGQGALGVETRSGDRDVLEFVGRLAHQDTMVCVTAERAVNRRLGGSCHVPVAGHARLASGELSLTALVGAIDGSALLRRSRRGDRRSPEVLGDILGKELLDAGAGAILEGLTR